MSDMHVTTLRRSSCIIAPSYKGNLRLVSSSIIKRRKIFFSAGVRDLSSFLHVLM